MTVHIRDRISFKLARIGVILAFVVGLVLSCFQLYRDYQEEGDNLNAIVTRILTVAEPPASRAVHILDEDLAAEVVNGLLEYEFIKSATVAHIRDVATKFYSLEQLASSIAKAFDEPI